jgi:RNA polymerase sigma-70 factor (ECF subfamily)
VANELSPVEHAAAARHPLAASDISALTRAIAQGDEAAFREFHQRYAGRLFGYALVLHGGDDTRARETWQTTLVKVAGRMKPFAGEPQLWAWLATIARNAALDAHRSSSRFARLRDRLAWWQPAPAPGEDERDPGAILHAALGQLMPSDRALLEAKYFDDRPVRAIAAERKSSEKAIESALTRARQRLRTAFLEELRHD